MAALIQWLRGDFTLTVFIIFDCTTVEKRRDNCDHMSNSASIWVDADACPKVIREILFRAAQRAEIQLILVANHALPVPKSALIQVHTGRAGV